MCEGDEEDGGGETEKINLEHHRGKVRNKGAEFISGPLWGEQAATTCWVAVKKDDPLHVDVVVFIY